MKTRTARGIFAALLILLLWPIAAKAVTPQITVSATATTLLGTSQTISITVQLIDPAQTGLLKIVGTNIIPPGSASTVVPGVTAQVGPIWGSDVIANAFGVVNTTIYRCQVFTVSNGVISSTPVFSSFFQFVGSGTVDLSTATPVAPTFMAGPNGSVVLTGTITAPSIGPSSAQQHTLPAVAPDTVALLAATQTLAAKTLTSPTSTGTDSGTETLQNKTLTGASNGNSVTLLCSSGPAAAIVGNSSPQNIFSCTIPANAVANLKGMRVTAVWSHSTGTAAVTYGMTLNGVACWPSNNSAATVGGLSQLANFIETGSTTGNVMTQQGFFSFTATTLTGLSWTAGQTLAVTFNVANTDQVTPLFFLVELIQ